MHDVFISYSGRDKNAADAVCHALEADGIRCWIAPRDIFAGKDWSESILTAILNCKVFVLVLSRQSSAARQVQSEVLTAVAENRIVVPFRIEDIYPGGALRLQLSGTHWLDAFPPPLDPHLKKLSETLRLLMGEASPQPAPTPVVPIATGGSTEKRKAEENPRTQFETSEVDANGRGILQDQPEAVRRYRNAADQGSAEDQNNLGRAYAQGLGGEKDQREALKRYRKAAEHGYAPAQNATGLAYQNGSGVVDDEGEALSWYRKAASIILPLKNYWFQLVALALILSATLLAVDYRPTLYKLHSGPQPALPPAPNDNRDESASDQGQKLVAHAPSSVPPNIVSPVQSAEPNMSCGQVYSESWDHCVGSRTYPNGNAYLGEFHHGMREGFGVIYINARGVSNSNNILAIEPSIYAGEFHGNKLNGHGVWLTKSGAAYSGTFVDNIPQPDVSQKNCRGQQSSAWSNCVAESADASGNLYRGEFVNGQREGVGMLEIRVTGTSDKTGIQSPVHRVYVGEFAGGRLNGPGLFFMPGAGFYGTFKNNVLTRPTS